MAVADPASETFYGMGRMASGVEIPFAGGGYAFRNVTHGDIRIKRYSYTDFTNISECVTLTSYIHQGKRI